MPLVYGNSPAVTFPNTAPDALAKELTVTVREPEQLPMAPLSQSTTWIYCHKLPPGHVYYGEQLGRTEVISLEINTFWGYTDEVELVDSRFTQSDKNAS